jgi:hypothetical protein
VVGYVRARSYVCCGEDGDQIDACVNGCVCARESGMSCEASLSHRSIMSTHTAHRTLTSPPPRLSHLHARAHPQGHALVLTLVQSPHVTSRTSSQLPTQSQSQSRTLHLTSHHISLTSPPRYLCGIFRQFNQALFPATFNSPRLHKWCVRMPQYLALARIRRVSLQDLLRCQLWRSLCANSVSLDHAPPVTTRERLSALGSPTQSTLPCYSHGSLAEAWPLVNPPSLSRHNTLFGWGCRTNWSICMRTVTRSNAV